MSAQEDAAKLLKHVRTQVHSLPPQTRDKWVRLRDAVVAMPYDERSVFFLFALTIKIQDVDRILTS